MYKTLLTICFSCFLLVGCITVDPVSKAWEKPEKPELSKVHFERSGDNLYLDIENSRKLNDNLLEMKAYQKKLEFLIDEMLRYYTK